MSTTTKIVLSIILVSMYVFSAYHVFIGLINATAVQGFGGIVLIGMGLVLVIKLIFETTNN